MRIIKGLVVFSVLSSFAMESSAGPRETCQGLENELGYFASKVSRLKSRAHQLADADASRELDRLSGPLAQARSDARQCLSAAVGGGPPGMIREVMNRAIGAKVRIDTALRKLEKKLVPSVEGVRRVCEGLSAERDEAASAADGRPGAAGIVAKLDGALGDCLASPPPELKDAEDALSQARVALTKLRRLVKSDAEASAAKATCVSNPDGVESVARACRLLTIVNSCVVSLRNLRSLLAGAASNPAIAGPLAVDGASLKKRYFVASPTKATPAQIAKVNRRISYYEEGAKACSEWDARLIEARGLPADKSLLERFRDSGVGQALEGAGDALGNAGAAAKKALCGAPGVRALCKIVDEFGACYQSAKAAVKTAGRALPLSVARLSRWASGSASLTKSLLSDLRDAKSALQKAYGDCKAWLKKSGGILKDEAKALYEAAKKKLCGLNFVTQSICKYLPRAKQCVVDAGRAAKQVPAVLRSFASRGLDFVMERLGWKSARTKLPSAAAKGFKAQVEKALGECKKWVKDTAAGIKADFCARSPVVQFFCDVAPRAKQCLKDTLAAGKAVPAVLKELGRGGLAWIKKKLGFGGGGGSDKALRSQQAKVRAALESCKKFVKDAVGEAKRRVCGSSPFAQMLCDSAGDAKACVKRAAELRKHAPAIVRDLARDALGWVRKKLGFKRPSVATQRSYQRQLDAAFAECKRWGVATLSKVAKALCGDNDVCKGFIDELRNQKIPLSLSGLWQNRTRVALLLGRVAFPEGVETALTLSAEVSAKVRVLLKGATSLSAAVTRTGDVYEVTFRGTSGGSVGVGHAEQGKEGSASIGLSTGKTAKVRLDARSASDWKQLLTLGFGMAVQTIASRAMHGMGSWVLAGVTRVLKSIGIRVPWDPELLSKLGILTGSGCELCASGDVSGKLNLRGLLDLEVGAKGDLCLQADFDRAARTLAITARRGLEATASAKLGEKSKKALEQANKVLEKLGKWMRSASSIDGSALEDKLNLSAGLGGSLVLTYSNVDWPANATECGLGTIAKTIGKRRPSVSQSWSLSRRFGAGGALVTLTFSADGGGFVDAALLAAGPIGILGNLMLRGDNGKQLRYTLASTAAGLGKSKTRDLRRKKQAEAGEGTPVELKVGAQIETTQTLASGTWTLGQLRRFQLPRVKPAAATDEGASDGGEQAPEEAGPAEAQGSEAQAEPPSAAPQEGEGQ